MPGAALRLRLGHQALWSPHVLTRSVVKGWWNANDLADGAPSTWVDRMSKMSTTAAGTPTVAATSFNGQKRGVSFSATADCFATATTGPLPIGTAPGEIWAAVDCAGDPALTATRNIVRYGTHGAATYRGIYRGSSGGLNRAGVSSGSDVAEVLLDGSVDFGGCHIIGGIFSGTTITGRVDGRPTVPASSEVATINTGTTRLRIGAGVSGSANQLWQGVIRHIFITTLLTAHQRQQLEGWMAWDCGLQARLPSGHPYRNGPP